LFQAFFTDDHDTSLFWSTFLNLVAIWIPIFFFHFVLSFSGRLAVKKKELLGYYIGVGSYFLVALMAPAQFVSDVVPRLSFKYYPTAGMVYYFFPLLFGYFVIYGLTLLLKELILSSSTRRNQIKYLLFGVGVGFAGGSTTFPPVFGIAIHPVGTFFVPVYVLTVAYAIIKYRLMDIDLARRYIAIYISYGIVSLAIFTPLIFLFRHSLFGLIAVSIMMVLLIPYLHRWITQFLQPTFLGEKYAYWNKLAKFWEKDRVVFTPAQLADALGEIPGEMALESWSFFLFDRDRDVFVPKAYQGLDGIFDQEQAEVLNTLYPDDPLVVCLEKEKKMILRDELLAQENTTHKAVIAQMDQIKTSIRTD
jgi:two-component system nitrogen regulation sensor histidine kinase GlnL